MKTAAPISPFKRCVAFEMRARVPRRGNGGVPAQAAVWHRRERCCRLLVEYGAPLGARNLKGRSPRAHAHARRRRDNSGKATCAVPSTARAVPSTARAVPSTRLEFRQKGPRPRCPARAKVTCPRRQGDAARVGRGEEGRRRRARDHRRAPRRRDAPGALDVFAVGPAAAERGGRGRRAAAREPAARAANELARHRRRRRGARGRGVLRRGPRTRAAFPPKRPEGRLRVAAAAASRPGSRPRRRRGRPAARFRGRGGVAARFRGRGGVETRFRGPALRPESADGRPAPRRSCRRRRPRPRARGPTRASATRRPCGGPRCRQAAAGRAIPCTSRRRPRRRRRGAAAPRRRRPPRRPRRSAAASGPRCSRTWTGTSRAATRRRRRRARRPCRRPAPRPATSCSGSSGCGAAAGRRCRRRGTRRRGRRKGFVFT